MIFFHLFFYHFIQTVVIEIIKAFYSGGLCHIFSNEGQCAKYREPVYNYKPVTLRLNLFPHRQHREPFR